MSNPRMVVATSRVRKPHSTNVCITPAYRSRSNWFSFESTVFVAATVRAGRFVSRSRGSSLPAGVRREPGVHPVQEHEDRDYGEPVERDLPDWTDCPERLPGGRLQGSHNRSGGYGRVKACHNAGRVARCFRLYDAAARAATTTVAARAATPRSPRPPPPTPADRERRVVRGTERESRERRIPRETSAFSAVPNRSARPNARLIPATATSRMRSRTGSAPPPRARTASRAVSKSRFNSGRNRNTSATPVPRNWPGFPGPNAGSPLASPGPAST